MLFNLTKLLYQFYQLNKIYFLRYILRFIFFILCTTYIINVVHAEKNDANKPTIIESERVTINESTQTKIFEGNVIINKGTLLIKADRIEASVDANGYQMLKAQGRKEQPTRFQQKRDGLDEIIEAQSVRLVFDGKADTITLFDQAIIRRVSKNILQDEVRGATIKYFNQTNSYEVNGGSSSSQANGRVRTIIAPRTTGQ
ncbi:MAG: lipopolysaccharide transport periplasmic protein LptA [Pseudomonadota bacterium]|jgi:lipopolysaccharide export system protein LptA